MYAAALYLEVIPSHFERLTAMYTSWHKSKTKQLKVSLKLSPLIENTKINQLEGPINVVLGSFAVFC